MKLDYSELASYKYVSFDVFDTLIVRNVSKPIDIFQYVEMAAIQEFGNKFYGFAEKRVIAERKARTCCNQEEVSIEEIYSSFDAGYFLSSEKNWALNKELEIELQFCVANDSIYEIYNQCLRQGKTIIITTDIYLPGDFIEKLLRDNGYDGWSYLFVSCEEKLTKRSGNLFKKVVTDIGIKPTEIVHLGDNKISDVKKPISLGIKGILVVNDSHLSYKHNEKVLLGDHSAEAFAEHTISSVPKELRLGYECMGPLLYGFSSWLLNRLSAYNIKKVFFLSRDGYIMKKAFDILFSDQAVTSEYFFASRRALRVPLLAFAPDYQEFVSSNYWPQKVAKSYFLQTLGLEGDNDLYIRQMEEGEYSVDRENITTDEKLKKIYCDLLPSISESAKDELNAFLTYCDQEHMEGNVAIVDIGWHGNMQLNMSRILQKSGVNIQIYGFYIGVSKVKNHKKEQHMEGYAFDCEKDEDLFEIERNVNSLFEQVFLAPHGSVQRYCKDNGKAKPVLYALEQTDEKSTEILENFQQGALQYVSKIANYQDLIQVSNRYAIKSLLTFFISPQMADAHQWSNIIFKDVKEEKLVTYKPLIYYICHPKTFFQDYKKSIWKEGFLKLVFRGNNDYYQWSQNIVKLRYLTHYKNKK